MSLDWKSSEFVLPCLLQQPGRRPGLPLLHLLRRELRLLALRGPWPARPPLEIVGSPPASLDDAEPQVYQAGLHTDRQLLQLARAALGAPSRAQFGFW